MSNNHVVSVAKEIWEEFVDAFLVDGGKFHNQRSDDLRTDFPTALYIFLLNRGALFRRNFLAPPKHNEDSLVDSSIFISGVIDGKDVEISEHEWDEIFIYQETCARRLMVGTNGKYNGLTTAHRLLVALLRFCDSMPDAEQCYADRAKSPIPEPISDNTPAGILSQRLSKLCEVEKDRIRATQYKNGTKHGYLKFSASPTFLQNAGPIHLYIGESVLAVPEEMALDEVFYCLPTTLNRRLIDECKLTENEILSANELESSDSETVNPAEARAGVRRRLKSEGEFTQGYETWSLFLRCWETLDAKYRQALRTGLPTRTALEFSMGQCDTITRIVAMAKSLLSKSRRDSENNDHHTELNEGIIRDAWDELEAKDETDGFQNFEMFWMAAGIDLISGSHFVQVSFEDNLDENERSERNIDALLWRQLGDGIEVPGKNGSEEVTTWKEFHSQGNLTKAEMVALEVIRDWGPKRTNSTFKFTPQERERLMQILRVEFPYTLFKEKGVFNGFEFFFHRRMTIILQPGQIPNRKQLDKFTHKQKQYLDPRPAESHLLQMEKTFRHTHSEHAPTDEFIDGLANDNTLKTLLCRKPYKWAAEESRVDLLLFFCERDFRYPIMGPALQS